MRSTMSRRATPPLAWLRAFEAAGRLGSFKGAAEALNVSPSTVSHQIRDLELWLETPLFSRGAKTIALTREGERYLAPLTAAFDLLRSASDSIEPRPDRLRIGAFPFLVNEVLVPNVSAIRDALGVAHLSFHSDTHRAALLHAEPDSRLDVLIRYHDRTEMPGLLVRELFAIELVPIKAVGSPPIPDLETLLAQPIVRVLGPFDAWQQWATALGVPSRPARYRMATDSYHAAVLAVSGGAGICLGISPFIRPWLAEGRIETVEAFRAPIRYSACLVYAPHQRDNPYIDGLHGWLTHFLG
jgi:LysR family glycine cleavage system transcriptional activator